MKENLFVYGTLCPGRANEHILQPINGTFTPASTRGTLIPEGWGAAQGYPGLLPNVGDDIVQGYVFTAELTDHWQMLDDFEGEGYERVRITVTLENGDTDSAWVYALRPKTTS